MKRLLIWMKRAVSKCAAYLKVHSVFANFLCFCAFFLVFFLIYFNVSTLSSGDDHFFHFRFAQEMLRHGFFQSFWDFKSIYFSRMAQGNAYFMYYNFLFYLVAIPFTVFNPLYLGIKLYAVCVAAAAFTLLYWTIKKIHVGNPFIWTLVILAITSNTSIWRFFLSRPYALAPSLLLLLLYFLYKKNHIGVFAVSFLYLFWHSSTFFLPGCVAIAFYVIERFYGEKGDLKNLIAGIGGTLTAIAATYVVSAGFLVFIWDTLVKIYWETIVGKTVHISEGSELYPTDFFSFIQGNALIFASFVMALSVDMFSYFNYRFRGAPANDYFADQDRSRRHLHSTILILTSGFFLGTVAISGRFGDYFTFFSALYIALSFDYARRLVKVTGSKTIMKSVGVSLMIVLAYLFLSNMLFLEQKLAYGQSTIQLFQTGNWLEKNSKPGDIVFIANWSWFPQLYYWSPDDYYSSGLEPRFMYDYDPHLYWLSVHIPQDGNTCDVESCPALDEKTRLAIQNSTSSLAYAKTEGDIIANVMRSKFKASYIVTSSDFRLFNYILSNNANFSRGIYDNIFGMFVFKVNATSTTSK